MNKDLEGKLVDCILDQVISNLEIGGLDEVYLDPDTVSEQINSLLIEVLNEDEIKEIVKEKFRTIIKSVDADLISKDVETKVRKGFLRKFLNL